MAEPTLLPVRPGTISDEDRALLRDFGVIVIEHENPEELRLIQPGVEIDAGTMLTSALAALARVGDTYNKGTLQRSAFVFELAKAISR